MVSAEVHCKYGHGAFPKGTAYIYEYLNIDREIVKVLSENKIFDSICVNIGLMRNPTKLFATTMKINSNVMPLSEQRDI